MGIMDGIKKGLKEAIFVEDESPKPVKTESPPKQVKPEIKPIDITVSKEVSMMASDNIDSKIYEAIRKAVESTGNSVSQFSEMIASLADVIPDESVRYIAAAKAVSKMGITTDQIIKEMDNKLKALEEEKLKLERVLTEKESGIQNLSAQLQQKDNAINNLLQQVEQLKNEKEILNKNIENETEKNKQSRIKVESTVAIIRKEIISQKENILKYIGGK